MDASSFHWIEKEVWHLHVAIDDVDGKIVGAYFDYQETLKGYYNVLHQILTKKTDLQMLRTHSLSSLMPVII